MNEPPLVAVVDDDPAIRATLEEILTREGLRVAPCDGADALWRLMAGSMPDLLLLDVRMPGEDGLSVARRVRAVSDAGIIMVSGLGEPVDKVVGLEVGADDYLAKPFDPRELMARVRSVLRRRNARRSAGPDLMGRIDTLARKLDQVGEEVRQLSDETHHIDQEAVAIEGLLHEHRQKSCPQCGSAIVYHRAEAGSLGICGSCGWSHFVEE